MEENNRALPIIDDRPKTPKEIFTMREELENTNDDDTPRHKEKAT